MESSLPSDHALAADADLAAIGKAIADGSRTRMLSGLMTGTAWTVGELASRAGIGRSTASEHVQQLSAAGLVTIVRQGRHAYVTLAGPQVAAALEALSLVAPARAPVRSLRGQRSARELVEGRTCYRHLAGRLGVGLTDHLLEHGMVTTGFDVTERGRQWFADRGVEIAGTRRDPLLRPCMDWTERRPHLAGHLADRLTEQALAQRWLERGTHPRSVRVTVTGGHYLLDG